MNRLITLLTIILAIVLVVPAAYAEGSNKRADQQISRDLSPAAFFGYTENDQATANVTDSTARVADEKRAEALNEGDTRFRNLSQAEFFGYTNSKPATEIAIKGPVKIAAADCPCGKTTEIKSSASIYHHLSPAEFFYGFTQPNAKVERCAHC